MTGESLFAGGLGGVGHFGDGTPCQTSLKLESICANALGGSPVWIEDN